MFSLEENEVVRELLYLIRDMLDAANYVASMPTKGLKHEADSLRDSVQRYNQRYDTFGQKMRTLAKGDSDETP